MASWECIRMIMKADNLKELKNIIKIEWKTLSEIKDDLFKEFGEVKNGKRR